MADGHPVPVDLDLLADYDCGALAGTADEARVAALLDSDPEWAAAYAALTAADPQLRADLAELGAAPEPMPTDILHRVLAALPAEPAPVRELPVARRRFPRSWGWAAAAAVVVLAGIGVVVGLGTTGGGNGSTNSGRRAAPAATSSSEPNLMGKRAGPEDEPNPEGVHLVATGTNYTPATLSQVPSAGAAATLPPGQRGEVPRALRRLTEMSALNQCLRAVSTVHPGAARLADYARFDGSPALILVLDKGTVVAGPSCGQRGADIRYQTGQ